MATTTNSIRVKYTDYDDTDTSISFAGVDPTLCTDANAKNLAENLVDSGEGYVRVPKRVNAVEQISTTTTELNYKSA